MKKLFFAGGIVLAVIVLSMMGCSKQSEDVLAAKAGIAGCDTTQVSYMADIAPILQSFCYECHGNGSSSGSGGILLEGYTNLVVWAKNGYLVGCVSHAPGFVAMPYELPKLSDCEINKIMAWVDQGSGNN